MDKLLESAVIKFMRLDNTNLFQSDSNRLNEDTDVPLFYPICTEPKPDLQRIEENA